MTKTKFTKILSMLVAMSMLMLVSACGNDGTGKATPSPSAKTATSAKPTASPAATLDPKLLEKKVGITITLEDDSQIKAELYPELAPVTVSNFVKLVNEKFYDGLIFHRVIPNFMIQGGGYDKDMNEKKASSIKGEFAQNGVTNALKHDRGVLSMARTAQSMDSASSQFFIMHADSPHLDGQYAGFGMVTEGMDVVDKIATAQTKNLPNGMQNVPEEAIVIKSITLDNPEDAALADQAGSSAAPEASAKATSAATISTTAPKA
jgi:peptidyl-prolyl cis-trans isomerase B (cyclophilin B)